MVCHLQGRGGGGVGVCVAPDTLTPRRGKGGKIKIKYHFLASAGGIRLLYTAI